MIKFFRKIRQKMLTENKFSKYLLYAIGEIILVVIGILIALSINNWNNQRLADKQMTLFLRGIQEDMKSDTSAFSRRIDLFKSLAEQKKYLLKLSNFDDIDADSITSVIRPRRSNYEINTTTFNKITSSGITQISKNDSLSKAIYGYYTLAVTSLKSYMNWDFEGNNVARNYYYFGDNVFEVDLNQYDLEDTDDILNFQDSVIRKENLIKILTEPVGRNHVKLDFQRKQRIANLLVRYKESVGNLIADIEKELNK